MGNIIFDCPHCGKSLEVEESGAGLSVPCPVCGKEVVIPNPSNAPLRIVLPHQAQQLNGRTDAGARKSRAIYAYGLTVLMTVLVVVGGIVWWENGGAVKWHRRAAEQGDVRAQRSLGVSYAGGEGVPQDPGEAVKWFRRAAEQGDDGAQCMLGACYAHGLGVPKSDVQAYKWFNLAAAQRTKEAAENRQRDKVSILWLIPSDSRKTPSSAQIAEVERDVAAKVRKEAAEKREQIAADMTPDQIAEAQRLSAAFVPRKEVARQPALQR